LTINQTSGLYGDIIGHYPLQHRLGVAALDAEFGKGGHVE
jgi:hypothetical protein